jgi:3'-5' exoribonuclease
MRYIAEFKEDDHIVGHYFCKRKLCMKSKAGKSYYSLKLSDKTGTIDAKVWDMTNDIGAFEENDYIKIDGTVLTYMNELQIKLIKIRRSEESEYIPADYIPCSEKDVAALFDELTEIIKSVSNPHLRKLLTAVFADKEVTEAFKSHSAAKALHHSFMGGLLEHTVSVANIADFLSKNYKHVNRDLTVAAAVLHDVGKIYELSPFPVNDYTDDGQLLGHAHLGIELIAKMAEKIEKFPPKLLTLLKHCIISHHGEYIFGAARRPKIIEAYIVHAADDADAKIKTIETAISEDNTNNQWLGYNKCLERNLRKSGFDDE